MSKKTILSICLVVLGVIIGLLVISTYAMSAGKASITLIFLAVAIICILAGSVLAFSRLLDRVVSPMIDEIHADIEDDIEDIKESRITSTIWMIIIVGIGLLIFSIIVFRFHKIEALWGNVPVVIPTLIGMGALAWFILSTRWFKESRSYTPMWIYFIPTIGFIITLAVGLFKTENLGVLRAVPDESIVYNSYQSTGNILQITGDIGGSGLELDLPDCDGDDCAVLLVIGLVILVFVLVIGSALIPHFWLLSGSLLLSVMVLIAIHDLRIRRSLNSTSKAESTSMDSNKQPESINKT